METDTYKTLNVQTESVLFKEKGSKFFGYAFPVKSDEDIKEHIKNLRHQHPQARHCCYAYQIGTEKTEYKANDDGEPNNTAGLPIYGQIKSFGLTNILVVVIRYFGGTKLGVGGLIAAYKETAKLTLEQSEIIEKIIERQFVISFDYKDINRIMRIIKERKLTIINHQTESLKEKIVISTSRGTAETIFSIFDAFHEVEIKPI